MADGRTAGPPAQGGPRNNMHGIVALIVGIVSIPLDFCFFVGIPLGAAAAVLGYIGMQRSAAGQASNKGVAMAGAICGLIGVGLGLFLLVVSIILQFGSATGLE